MRRLRVVLLGVLLAASPGWLGAQPTPNERAAIHDRRARAAFDAGRFSEAAEAFEEANRQSPHARTRFNVALAWDKAGDAPRAADAYESALHEPGLDDERTRAAQARLAELKPLLGYLFVREPAAAVASVGHAREVPVPARIHLRPGSYVLRVRRLDGALEEIAVELRGGQRTEVSASTLIAPAASASAAQASSAASAPAEARSPRGRVLGWSLLGAGAVLGGVGVASFVRALSLHDEYVNDRLGKAPLPEQEATRSQGQRAERLGYALGAGALVLGGLGTYFLWTSRPEPVAPGTLSVRVGPLGGSVRLRF